MTTYDLILKRRTIRRFLQKDIPKQLLENMLNSARLAPSGSNLQPLEFIAVVAKDLLNPVFMTTKWAGYITPKGTPAAGEQPVAYIVVVINRKIRPSGGEHDCAAAIMNMILTALEQDVGCCWIGSLEKQKLQEILLIPSDYEIDSVLALGYPAEEPVVEEFVDSVKYWKDEQSVLHVPKRKLKNLLHWDGFKRLRP